jgi:hypothetical protein
MRVHHLLRSATEEQDEGLRQGTEMAGFMVGSRTGIAPFAKVYSVASMVNVINSPEKLIQGLEHVLKYITRGSTISKFIVASTFNSEVSSSGQLRI